MPGEMTFRKDCEECGRSFLTPDKKAKICQRCAGKGHEKLRPETVTPKGTTGQTQKSLGKAQSPDRLMAQRPGSPGDRPQRKRPRGDRAQGSAGASGERKSRPQGSTSNPRSKKGRGRANPGADSRNRIERYQTYVQRSRETTERKAKDHRRRYGNSIPERCPGLEAVESTAGSNRGFDPGRALLHRKSLFFPSGRKKFLLGNQRSDRSRDRLEPLGGLPLSGPSS